MLIRKCDRCGEIIKDNYWTIDIYERENSRGTITSYGAMNNLQKSTEKITNTEKEYCRKCIDDIKNYIEKNIKE